MSSFTSVIQSALILQSVINLRYSLNLDNPHYFCKMEIYKEFSFDSAHFLPNVPDGHKCKEMHGHTYRLKVFIKGELDPQLGWIMDFKDLKEALLPVIDQLDHKLINNIQGLQNPTAENITVWIWQQIKPSLPLLSRIELYETPTTGVIYHGE